MNAPAATDPTQHIVYISLGSNIEPERNLPRALALLRERSEVEAASSAWRSPAAGAPGPEFLNAALRLRTPLAEPALKHMLRAIEADLGRVRSANPNAPRPIDLDIVLFDGALRDEELWRFAHLALPLSELLPELVAPDGRRLAEYAGQLAKEHDIQIAPGVLPNKKSRS